VAKRGLTLHDRLVGYLPRYAPYAARAPWLMNLRNNVPALARWSERATGFSARRKLPRWRRTTPFPSPACGGGLGRGPDDAKSVVLFADTFNRYFEPENIEAALTVLRAAGYGVHLPPPLCCGRTFLSVGLVDEARKEAQRCVATLAPFVAHGIPIVGLEPSCVLGFRDEIRALATGVPEVLLLEEFLAREAEEGRLTLPLKPVAKRALLHGHCHQKSFGAMGAVEAVLRLIPDLAVETVESSCCGMAGAFGYGADTIDVSLKMAELSLLPAVRKADAETLIVADGTSCRHQIADGAGRAALHVARVLALGLSS
jgi:Fe-S oxidoreductase